MLDRFYFFSLFFVFKNYICWCLPKHRTCIKVRKRVSTIWNFVTFDILNMHSICMISCPIIILMWKCVRKYTFKMYKILDFDYEKMKAITYQDYSLRCIKQVVNKWCKYCMLLAYCLLQFTFHRLEKCEWKN